MSNTEIWNLRMKKSQNNILPFLDVNINTTDGSFATSIYRKNTFTGLLLNFNAFCPVQWKRGLILGCYTGLILYVHHGHL